MGSVERGNLIAETGNSRVKAFVCTMWLFVIGCAILFVGAIRITDDTPDYVALIFLFGALCFTVPYLFSWQAYLFQKFTLRVYSRGMDISTIGFVPWGEITEVESSPRAFDFTLTDVAKPQKNILNGGVRFYEVEGTSPRLMWVTVRLHPWFATMSHADFIDKIKLYIPESSKLIEEDDDDEEEEEPDEQPAR